MQRITYDSIVKDGHPSLRNKSQSVPVPVNRQDFALAKRMLRYVKDSRDDIKAEKHHLKPAVGLSAPQIGINKQLIVVMIDDDDGYFQEYVYANPKIVSHSVQKSAISSGEGCLSVETVHPGLVHRHSRVTIKAYDIHNQKEVMLRATGFLSIVFQHEIDHLNGVLFYDHIDKDEPWKMKESTELINM